MPRVPYQPANIADPEALVDAIRTRRGGTLLNLDRMLLHSPAYAAGWNALLRAVRQELSLAPKLRELAVCVVAVLTGADYEFHHHAPEYVKAGGTMAQVGALRRMTTNNFDTELFSTEERAVINLTVAMTRDVTVDNVTFDAVSAILPNPQQVVELVGTIATYNMVARFLVALGIEPE